MLSEKEGPLRESTGFVACGTVTRGEVNDGGLGVEAEVGDHAD